MKRPPLPALLASLRDDGLLDQTEHDDLLRRLDPPTRLLRAAQRAWLWRQCAALAGAATVALVAVAAPAPAGSRALVAPAAFALLLAASGLAERARQRRAASIMLILRLLDHARALGEVTPTDLAGHRLRRLIAAMETTADIAGQDSLRQRTAARPNPRLRTGCERISAWLRAASQAAAVNGPEETAVLRRDLVEVAVAVARPDWETAAAAAHASAQRLGQCTNDQPGRRAHAATAARLAAAFAVLLVARAAIDGAGALATTSLEAAMAAVAVAAALWAATGRDPAAALTSRFARLPVPAAGDGQ